MQVLCFVDVLSQLLLDRLALQVLLFSKLLYRGGCEHLWGAPRALAARDAVIVPHLEPMFDPIARKNGEIIKVPTMEELLARIARVDGQLLNAVAEVFGNTVSALNESIMEQQAAEPVVVTDLAAVKETLWRGAVALHFHGDRGVHVRDHLYAMAHDLPALMGTTTRNKLVRAAL